MHCLPRIKNFKGFDVVQVINPCFLTLPVSINRYFFGKLIKNNTKVFLGAFGDDSYWVRACMGNKIFKYSEFFVDSKSTELKYNKVLEQRWINSTRETLNKHVAKNVDGIVACLYEYYKSYEPYFANKLCYIPLPINLDKIVFKHIDTIPQKLKFFIGINKDRSEYKGTDLMEEVLHSFAQDNADRVEVIRVESENYDTYQRLMQESHVVLDQLYSHSPSMNALLAMAQGKVVVSGGEPEMYELMEKVENRPIINVLPNEKDIYNKLEKILKDKDKLPSLSMQSRSFVEQYHNCESVARKYVSFWTSNS